MLDNYPFENENSEDERADREEERRRAKVEKNWEHSIKSKYLLQKSYKVSKVSRFYFSDISEYT